ncbi:MAG: hypothetical protein ACOWYE_09000 [Desulfatiglandales bacterium]
MGEFFGCTGNIRGFFNLKTNCKQKPLINILIRAHLAQGKTNQGK